jgi:hypothetical protein
MNRPVQMKITDEELWGEVPLAATFENVKVGYKLLVLSYGIGQDSWALLVKWFEFDRRKLEANQRMGDKNLGVWGKKTLQEVLAEAKEKYHDWSGKDLTRDRFSHGHCVSSRY